jgi:YebC/PmpR family DNA-binding regulatory protein
MAGHSKWANIKRQKARVDAKKGKTFAQLSRAIIVATRHGLPEPEANFQLRTAIDKAKAAGIPNENIERAIAKGAGTYANEEADYEEIRYEGYGPGGAAILIEALTDNRNRTAADLRAAFSKNGGNLGETGCVSWMFQQKGVVRLEGQFEEEALLEASLSVEADSYEIDEAGADVFTQIGNLENIGKALTKLGFCVMESEVRWIPDHTMEISDPDQGRSLLKLIDTLENLDDVQNVTANFDLSDELINQEI